MKESPAAQGETYEDLPYVSYAFAHTHPWRMAVIGRAFGVATAAPARARVLELGCGTGWNAAAMAWSLPGADVVAIDRSPRHIAIGKDHVARLGVGRCRLEVGDLLTLEPTALGSFDYIIAHGVYGWVPRDVQERLMALARACLAPGGIFYMSTNVYPGSAVRDAVREMMRWAAGDARGVLELATRGRDFMLAMGRVVGEIDAWWSSALGQEASVLGANDPAYAAHDHLAEDYRPSWFHELAAHAARHELTYLADARMSTSLGSTLPAAAREPMLALAREGAGGDARVEAERFQQILDCATGRLFRRALFVRREDAPRTAPDVGVLRTAWLASGIDRDDDGARRVEGREYVAPPDVDRALIALRQVAPATMSFEALASALGVAHDDLARGLGEAWGEGVLEVLAEPPRIVVNPERPRVGWPARVDVALGRDYATNLYHVSLKLSEAVRAVVPWLDGTRDRAVLAEVVPEPEKLEPALSWLGQSAFLEAD